MVPCDIFTYIGLTVTVNGNVIVANGEDEITLEPVILGSATVKIIYFENISTLAPYYKAFECYEFN